MLTGSQETRRLKETGEKEIISCSLRRLELLSPLVDRSTNEIKSIYIKWKKLKNSENPKLDLDFIARLLAVSKTTISNYINENLTHISEIKQEKIGQIIKILGYVPNYTARTIKRSVKKTYGVMANISETPSREYTGTLLKILHRKCEMAGYSLQIYDVKQDKQKEIFNAMPFLGMVDGLFIFGSDLERENYALLEQFDMPVVLVNPWNDVVSDNVIAKVYARLNGLEKLFTDTYHRVSKEACLITIYPEHYKERRKKIDLFARIYGNQPILYVDDYSVQSTIKIFDEIKNLRESVFFCLSDMTAIIVKEKFSQVGRSLYITGYDNSDLSSVFHIPTVDHNLKEQAERAFDVMHEGRRYFYSHGRFPKQQNIILESIFVDHTINE